MRLKKTLIMAAITAAISAFVLAGCTKQVTIVSLDKETLEVTHGETFVLNATILPDDADNKSVTWSVDSGNVSAVTNENNLQKEFSAASVGTARVKVVSSNGKSAVCDVTVTENDEDIAARQKAEEEAKIAAEKKAEEDAKIAAEKKVEERLSVGKKTLSDDGVKFSELTFIPDRGIVTFNIENTTRAAKFGYVDIACLDKDGLQIKRLCIRIEIEALGNDIFQEDNIPADTVAVKFLSAVTADQ